MIKRTQRQREQQKCIKFDSGLLIRSIYKLSGFLKKRKRTGRRLAKSPGVAAKLIEYEGNVENVEIFAVSCVDPPSTIPSKIHVLFGKQTGGRLVVFAAKLIEYAGNVGNAEIFAVSRRSSINGT